MRCVFLRTVIARRVLLSICVQFVYFLQGKNHNNNDFKMADVDAAGDTTGARTDDSSRTAEKRAAEDTTEPEGTPKRGKFVLADIEEPSGSSWSLDDDLKGFFHKYSVKYFADKSLEETVGEYPQPTNVKALELDANMETLIKKEGKTVVLERDNDLLRISKKLLAVMGPLGRAWTSLEEYRVDTTDSVQVNPEEMADQLQKSVILLGQTLNAITYQRRLNVMSSLGDAKEARAMLRDEKVTEALLTSEEKVLFGKPFEKPKSEAEASKGLVDYLNRHKKKPAASKSIQSATSGSSKTSRKPLFQKKPFQGAPPYHNGGRGFSDSHRGRGKLQGRKTKTQPNLGFRLSIASKKCTSHGKKPFFREGHKITPSGESRDVHRELESFNQRPGSPGYCEGVGNTLPSNPIPGKYPRGGDDELTREGGNGQGSGEYVGKRGHKGGYTKGGPVFEQRVCDPKSRGRFSTYNKSKKVESKHPIQPLQDGGVEGSKKPSSKRGLFSKVGPEGRLFRSSSQHQVSKDGPVHVAEKAIRISLPLLRVRTSTKGVHKIDESAPDTVKKTQHESGDLFRRFANSRREPGGCSDVSGHSPILISEVRSNSELEKIRVRAPIQAHISRDLDRQSGNEILSTRRESEEDPVPVSDQIDFREDDPQRIVISHGNSPGDKSSSFPSTPTVKEPATSQCSSPTPVPSLRLHGHHTSGGTGGIGLVGQEPEVVERLSATSSLPRNDHFFGCSQDGGLGCSLWKENHRGPMVNPREWAGYKHARVISGRTGNPHFYQGEETQVNSSANRQHDRSFILSEDGGYQVSRDDTGSKKNMVIPVGTQYNPHCGVDFDSPQCESGPRIEEHQGLFGVEIGPGGIPPVVPKIRNPNDRLVCLTNISSTDSIHELEGRPNVLRGRCLPASVVKRFPICIPPFLSHLKGTEPSGDAGSGQNVNHHSPLALAPLVSSNNVNDNKMSNSVIALTYNSDRPSRKSSSIDKELISESSGLGSIRDSLETEGVSEKARDLIVKSRRKGTIKNYQYAWQKWVEWCGSRKTNPFDCPLKDVLNFLAELFGQGLASRTIGTYRSAISAFHCPIEGVTVGKHPKVSSLMNGVSNSRPPVPKYAFTWDVEKVLRLFKEWGKNELLKDKHLSLKLAMLLSLTAASRCSELQLLDLKFLSKFSSRRSFEIHGTMKHLKRNQKPKPIDFYVFSEDEDLCPVKVIDCYEERSRQWRNEEYFPSSLFLSYVKPHAPLSSQSIARWIKEIIELSGINATVFKAHSVRGAASSKACTKGLSVKDILLKGNWSRESTWQKFYHRDIISPTEGFQRKVLEL